jgi:benzoate/toluate 1,2-dioxygenase reductase subunit
MIKPVKGLLKLVTKKQLSVKVTGVTFEIIEPKDFQFYPGQFISLLVGTGVIRAYSVCSDVNDLPNISLAVETGHDGVGSNHIRNMKEGGELSFIGPSGKLLLPGTLSEHPISDLPDHLCFFATGTGIAPFISLFCKLIDLKYKGKIELFFGIRKESEELFIEEFEDYKNKLQFNYKIFYSRPEDSSHISERITSVLPQMTDKDALYFICGHPLMTEQVLNGLKENGIEEKNIIKEEFTHPKQTGTV